MSVYAPKQAMYGSGKKAKPHKCLDCPALTFGKGRCKPCQADHVVRMASKYNKTTRKLKKGGK